jgi:2-hydroxychromene-2-carboxylate isomerase
MPATVVDYYFASVSPWAYLGHARFVAIAQAAGAAVRVKPVDLGVIFPVSGGLPLGKRAPQRQAYRLMELRRFSQHLGITLHPQPAHFPVDGNDAARLVLATDTAHGSAAALDLAHRVGRAIWAEQRDVADQLLHPASMDAAGARYAACTDEARELGVFGAPTYVIDGELFWGQDRLDFVQRRLQGG